MGIILLLWCERVPERKEKKEPQPTITMRYVCAGVTITV